jgi:hypothetical protein
VRLVYYSLANFPYDSREHQWIQSIRSFRLHDPSIPVWLFLFHGASKELLREADRWNVQVHLLGNYEEFLQQAYSRGSILGLVPLFHKFMVMPYLPLRKVEQILYLDCDTFFFNDVNLLFDHYAEKDWYAREEFRCIRSPLGYDPDHIDELLLQSIARGEGLQYVEPFNTGVCLLNRGIWDKLEGLSNSYLDLAWRLLCGRENSRTDDARDAALREAVMNTMTDSDRSRALPYPSQNDWIIEQIALWLALGGLPDFSLGTFSRTHVVQGGEFKSMIRPDHQCVLAHYFTGGEKHFFATVKPISD